MTPKALPRGRDLLVALVIFCTMGGALLLARPAETPIRADGVRDWCTAQAHLNETRSVAVGSTASFPGLRHGGAWHLHVRLMQVLGVPYHLLDLTLIPFAAVAVAAIFLGVAALAGRGAGLLASACFALPHVIYPELILARWNPSLVPLPAVALALAIVGAARYGRALFYPIAAVALSLLCSLHIAYHALLPGVVAALLLRPTRRNLAVLAGSGILFLASQATLSLDAQLHNLQAVLGGLEQQVYEGAPNANAFDPWAWGVPVVTTLAWVTSRARGGDSNRRVVDALALFTIPSLLLLVGFGAALDHEISYRYMAALAPAVSMLVVLALARAGRLAWHAVGLSIPHGQALLLRRAAVPVFVLALLVPAMAKPGRSTEPRTWISVQDVIHLADALPALGIRTFEDAFCSLRGPMVREILAGLSTQEGFYPYRTATGSRCPPERLSHLVWVERHLVFADAINLKESVLLRRESDGVFALTPYRSALDWNRLELSTEQSSSTWSPWRVLPLLSDAAYEVGFPTLFTAPGDWSGRLRMRVVPLDDAGGAVLSARCLHGASCQVRRRWEGLWTAPEPGGTEVSWRLPSPPPDAIVLEWTYDSELRTSVGIAPPLLEVRSSATRGSP